ncbi:uncharacterized protein K489DRAFT_58885 [Dissoconium aciculare CBS 342.82]|uniref:Secreted protein n=1 Tax=Dissoconium aciculare CBS 342.82 TaxID=1314786 RepID=A0A6J3LWW4_9PEZI|nr:uncharacterized protein K489DRAFT_58885 [Dissoconium aciculare CBS 342.82]KAF1819794.1 hypothetical protein K489DRAFT_58885 [Dissoconium aciculare CBS 342.82]
MCASSTEMLLGAWILDLALGQRRSLFSTCLRLYVKLAFLGRFAHCISDFRITRKSPLGFGKRLKGGLLWSQGVFELFCEYLFLFISRCHAYFS